MNNTLSSLGKLKWADIGKTILLTVLTLFFNWLLNNIASVEFSSDPVVNQGIIGTVSFVISYLLKQLGTDENGRILGIGKK